MTRALIYKEFRETLPIATVALACLAFLALDAMGYSVVPDLFGGRYSGTIPFVGYQEQFFGQFNMAAGAFALALGFWHSLGDFWGEAHLFVLHRPVNRHLPSIWRQFRLEQSGRVRLPTALPVRSYHLNWTNNPRPLRYATRPSAEIEKPPKPPTVEPTGSASRIGSPVNSTWFRSKRWAISVVWRTKATIPGARYRPVLSAAAHRFGSPPSSEPR